MMDAVIYRDKAAYLRERLEKADADEREEITEDFLNLVFFFAKDMPLYKEMTRISPDYGLRRLNSENVEYYMSKFIYYIDEYCYEQE